MKKILQIIIVILVLALSVLLYVTYNDSKKVQKELELYKKTASISFENNEITVANKKVKINENQKYYLLSGDCSEVTEDNKNLINYDTKDEFDGTTEWYVIKQDSVYRIYLSTNLTNSGYINNEFVADEASGFSKKTYSQLYNINFQCTNE